MDAAMEEVLEEDDKEDGSEEVYEEASSNGQPQEQEIEDYARFLGMDPDV